MRAYLVWVQSLSSIEVLLTPVICATRLDVHGWSISPLGHDTNSVEGGQRPHLGPVEILWSDTGADDRCADERSVVTDCVLGDARKVRDPGIDNVQCVVHPPHNRRPRPLGDVSIVENDGLADIEFPSQCPECCEIGTLHARLGSGVTRCGGQRDVGESVGSLTKVESQHRAIPIIDRLKAREPSSLGRNHGDGVGGKGASVQSGVNSGKRRRESFEVHRQIHGTAVNHEP